ncbi:hypothetical protein V466_29170 [Pseudomonas mandelii PD30]|jgi:hypothetical protein|uniref:Uncharacterized protein n=1 Tax=Pseudomonas mandelii PD30 TaxID=1419583 RepID=A0A059KTW7_9PSED|nr:hypothetical protein [Pseudomonas mandelii]KDD65507.1 hypothetical protein V466_29170 [Pseudomonas mandelii PD30]
MAEIKDGFRLDHHKAPNYISEYVDQFVSVGFGSGTEEKICVTFGRDIININHETLKEVSPGAFASTVSHDDYALNRIDYATFSMSFTAATRLRDMLNEVLTNHNQSAPKAG